jgi:hypothetical protein
MKNSCIIQYIIGILIVIFIYALAATLIITLFNYLALPFWAQPPICIIIFETLYYYKISLTELYNILKEECYTTIKTFNTQYGLNIAYVKYPNLEIISCEGSDITHIPHTLPYKLTRLDINFNNSIGTLPDILPATLQWLTISNCSYFTTLPNTLPDGLCEISINNAPNLVLPDILPKSLKELEIFESPITKLPAQLPSGLIALYCQDTQLTTLPDLPETLCEIEITSRNNGLILKYPLLNSEDPDDYDDETYAQVIVNHVNEINSRERVQARTRLINVTQPFLEHYMRRAMHPDRLAALKNDPTIDVDDFMTQYVESL